MTYQITAQLGWEAKSWKRYAFGLFNYDTGVQYGPFAEVLPPINGSIDVSGGVLDMIHTPEIDGKYCIKVAPDAEAGSSSKIRSDVGTVLNIVALSGKRNHNVVAAGLHQDKQSIRGGETWANQVIVMDKVMNRKGYIPYDEKNGRFYLYKNQTYRITAQLSWGLENTGTRYHPWYELYDYPRTFYAFGLFNEITGEQIGPLAEVLYRTLDTYNASGGVLDVIFTPPATGLYHLKMAPSVTADNKSKLRAASSYLNIVTL